MPISVATAERWYNSAEQKFQTCRQTREDCRLLINRFLTPVTDPKLLRHALAEYKVPELEKAKHDIADVEAQARTTINSVQGQEGDKARLAANIHAIWHSIINEELDSGGDWSHAVGEGHAADGYKISRLMIHEYDEEDYDDGEGARRRTPCWYIQDTDTIDIYFEPLTKPTRYLWKYTLPVHEYSVEGGKVPGSTKGKTYVPIADRLEASGLRWVDEAESTQGENFSTSADEKLTILVCEYLDKKRKCPVCPDHHPLWSGIEVVYGSGKASGNGQITNEYELPYRHKPTFRIVPGRTSSQRDPNLHFRPMLMPAIVHAANINWAYTVIMTLANRDSSTDRIMGQLMKDAPAAVVDQLQSSNWQIQLPPAKPDSITVAPVNDITRWPDELSPALLEFIKEEWPRFEQSLPNRFLLGEAFQEATYGAATTVLSQQQQARLPFDQLLRQKSQALLEMHEDIDHCILYWAYASGGKDEDRYYTRVMGGESLTSATAKPGQEVYLSAARLETHPKLHLSTQAETLAEQAERRSQAIQGFQMGFLDTEQVLKEWGYADPQAQMRILEAERVRRTAEPMETGLLENTLRFMWTVLADVEPMMMQPGPMMGGPQTGGPEAAQQPQPQVRLPATTSPRGEAGQQ